MSVSDNPAAERVWGVIPASVRDALERGLPPTDLQTLLIAIARARARQATAASVMRRWQDDRFVRPAVADPRRLATAEARLWQLLPPEFTGIELSPVTPLGTCAAVASVSQNRVVTTVRNTEVVSDSTNVLALEAAVRRRDRSASDQVHLAASHRQLRAQTFGAGAAAHFRLFALVSSGRDSGSGRTEASMLIRHLSYWLGVLQEMIPDRKPQIELSVFDSPVLAERLTDTIRPNLADPAGLLVDKPDRVRGRGYYAGVAVRLTADRGEVELGDGGLTTWTAQFSNNAKERCLVSCIATERLVSLTKPGP